MKVPNTYLQKILLSFFCLLFLSVTVSYAGVDLDELNQRIWKLEKIKASKVNQADEIFIKFDRSGTAYIITGSSWNSEKWSVDKINNLSMKLLGQDKWMVKLLNSSLLVLIPKESFNTSYTFIEMTDEANKERLAGIFKEINLNIKGLSSLLEKNPNSSANNTGTTSKSSKESKLYNELKSALKIEDQQEYTTTPDSPVATTNADKIEQPYTVDSDHRSAPARIKKEPVSSYVRVKSATAPSIYSASTNKSGGRSVNANRVNIPRKHVDPFTVSKRDYIEIFVSGGGFKGGINPKIHDRILIHNNGLIQKEFISVHGGEENLTTRVDKSELVDLAQIIVNSDYFNFKESYDCEADDRKCQTAVNGKPEPIPLKLVIAVGMLRHVVDVPVFAPGLNDVINYPKSLEDVVEAIYNIARK